MVTLTTSIMFLLFTCMHFWVWGILGRLYSAAYRIQGAWGNGILGAPIT
jgi:hypothetical protein